MLHGKWATRFDEGSNTRSAFSDKLIFTKPARPRSGGKADAGTLTDVPTRTRCQLIPGLSSRISRGCAWLFSDTNSSIVSKSSRSRLDFPSHVDGTVVSRDRSSTVTV